MSNFTIKVWVEARIKTWWRTLSQRHAVRLRCACQSVCFHVRELQGPQCKLYCHCLFFNICNNFSFTTIEISRSLECLLFFPVYVLQFLNHQFMQSILIHFWKLAYFNESSLLLHNASIFPRHKICHIKK